MGISFDECLLDIALQIMHRRHGAEYVNKYLSMVPKQYLEEDIETLLKREGVDHPLLSDNAKVRN